MSRQHKDYIHKYFTEYVEDSALKDTILLANPVPSNVAVLQKAPAVDTYLEEIFEDVGRSFKKSTDKGLATAQQRLLNAVGPLAKYGRALISFVCPVQR